MACLAVEKLVEQNTEDMQPQLGLVRDENRISRLFIDINKTLVSVINY